MKLGEAKAYREKIEMASASITDDALALQVVELFPRYVVGKAYEIGNRFQYEGILYQVIQAHTSQEDWIPSALPALYKLVSIEEYPEWVQPTGAHDAYNKGDKVTYNNLHYISSIDGNVYSPEAYPAGWELVS